MCRRVESFSQQEGRCLGREPPIARVWETNPTLVPKALDVLNIVVKSPGRGMSKTKHIVR